MASDYDVTFIISWKSRRAGGPLKMDFDTFDAAMNIAKLCNDPCEVREIGYDYFSQTHINQVRAVFG